MAMRPMTNNHRTITHTDLLIISALLGVALLLLILAQTLGFTLL